MSRSLPPLTWFRAFESAARNLSFTGAASELGLTQSAISQHVQALESRLGCLLFERKNRGLALTDEGRRLVPTVADALGTLRRATDSFDTGDHQQDIITVATSVSIAQWYIVPRMSDFIRQHGDVTVRVMTKVWPDEFSKLSVDVEIRFDSLASMRPNTKLLGSNQLGIVAAPDLLRRASKSTFTVDDICNQPLIQVVGTADGWQEWARVNGVSEKLRPSLFVDSHGMAIDLAKSGAGVALTSLTVAAPCVGNGSLVVVQTEQRPATDGYLLSIDPGVKSGLPEKFARWLEVQVEQAEQSILKSKINQNA